MRGCGAHVRAAEEARVADAVSMTAAWELVDGNKIKVEDSDKETEDYAELRAAEEAICGIGSARDGGGGACYDRARGASLGGGAHRGGLSACGGMDRPGRGGGAGRHWAAEMEKALTYQRDIGQREAGRLSDAHHRLERCQTVHRQDTASRVAMAVIDGAEPASHAAHGNAVSSHRERDGFPRRDGGDQD
jgi:hypothetical protein